MAANQVFDWEQSQLYLEASRTQILPGGSTRYHPSRDVGVTPTDRTSFIAGQADWSADNLPEIQYYLFPPADRDAFRRKAVENLRDANGQIINEQWPKPGQAARPLKDFPVLPRQIGTQDYPWIIDAWRKLDARIQGADVLMRMDPAGRPNRWNTFQQRLGRLRPDFYVISWHATRRNPNANVPTANVLAQLQPWHFEMNTTRGLTPGLLVPELGEDGGRVPLPVYEESRGFGREFQRRQGPNAGPAQTGRKQARKPKSQEAQADRLSSGSPDSGAADTNEDEDEEEQKPPPRKTRRLLPAPETTMPPTSTNLAPALYQTPTLPSSHLASTSRDSAGHGGQNEGLVYTQQAPWVYNQQASLVNTQLFSSVYTQQPMGMTPNPYQQYGHDNPGPRLAPYPPGFVGGPSPLRQLSTTQLLGRSSTDATNMVHYSGIGHSDRQTPYHPFTRMDVRNTQHFRPPLAPHLSAGAAPYAVPPPPPPIGNNNNNNNSNNRLEEEPRLRHFRLPGPSPTLTESETRENAAARGRGRGNGMPRYVDPLLERFFSQYTSSFRSGSLGTLCSGLEY